VTDELIDGTIVSSETTVVSGPPRYDQASLVSTVVEKAGYPSEAPAMLARRPRPASGSV
jgi:hypothetical protein